MEKSKIFLILGIQETKDEEQIKAAYRSKLTSVNPEEDPEGFKKLRQAYEEACRFAREKEERKLGELTPVELWLQKADDLYTSLSRRLDVEQWRILLNDETAVDLDTEQECKKHLLLFLQDHFRLPHQIWKFLDERLMLTETKEELKEYCYPDFLNYMYNQIENDSSFPFEYFKGDDKANYDLCLSCFFELAGAREINEKKRLLDQLDDLMIYHPFIERERAAYYQACERDEEACEIIEEQLKEYGSLGRLLYVGCQVFWKAGKKEKAKDCCEILLERSPEHYEANKIMSLYYKDAGDYKKAKEHTIEALQVNPHDEEMTAQLTEINHILMDEMRKKLQEEPENQKNRLDLGWCYLQNKDYVKGLAVVRDMEPEPKHEREYHNLLGKIYYSNSQYERAAEEMEKWQALLLEPDTEEEENAEQKEDPEKKKRERLLAAHSIKARCYREMAKHDRRLFDTALAESRKALEYAGDDPDYLLEEAMILKDMGHYEECVQACSQIIDKDSRYYPAYLIRQECFVQLKDAGGVINDYWNARNIYGGYVKIYEYAAEVYEALERWSDMEELLKDARENGVMNARLYLYQLSMYRRQIKSKDDEEGIKKAEEALELVEKQLEEEETPSVTEEQLEKEKSLLYWNEGETKKALDTIHIRSKGPECDNARWLRAFYFRELRQYQPALELLQECGRTYDNTERYHYYMGECYKGLFQRKEAIECYKKAVEIYPDYEEAHAALLSVYRALITRENDESYVELGLPHADKLLELDECSYYYVEKGLLFMEANRFEEAVINFNKALELESDNPYAYRNLAFVYRQTRRFEEAEKSMLKAISYCQNKVPGYFYEDLGDIYFPMREFEKAVDAYKMALEYYPDDEDTLDHLENIYEWQGDFEKAEELYRKRYGADGRKYREEMVDVYFSLDQWDNAWNANEKLKKDDEDGVYEENKAMLLSWKDKNLETAHNFRKSLKKLENKKNKSIYWNLCRNIASFYYWRGKKAEAAKYARMGLDALEKTFGSIEKYIHSMRYERADCYVAGLLYFYHGDKEKTKQILERMENAVWCRQCRYSCCVEAMILDGFLKWDAGELDEAVSIFERVLEEDKSTYSLIQWIKQIRKQKGNKK